MSSASKHPRGLDRIRHIFQTNRARGARTLMPFVCAGHPKPDATPDILLSLQDAGASIVEIGFPFSDPIADGPVIADAMEQALRAGTTPTGVIQQIANLRDRLDIGLIAMVSVSIVHRLGGPQGFTRACADAGFDGFIYPDAPLEESEDFLAAAVDRNLSASLLISPTTPDERAATIATRCTGFVYTLARTGITGERSEAPDIAERAATLKRATDTPIAVGFGISKPDHVNAVLEHADAAIVGSALVRRLNDATNPAQTAADFTRTLLN